MKRLYIENELNLPYKLFVEETPKRGERVINIFTYGKSEFLAKKFTKNNSRMVVSIDESGGAKTFILLVAQQGSGYIRRELSSGELVYGQVFHIASPLYYVKNPYRLEAADDVQTKTVFDSATGKQGVMFFPDGSSRFEVTINGRGAISYISRFGVGVGIAAKDFFFESTAFTIDSRLGGITNITMKNLETASVRCLAVGGDYEVL